MPEVLSERPEPSSMTTTSMSTSSNQSTHKTEAQTNGIVRDSSRLSRRKSKYERALLGRYRLGSTIGTGNFARVKLATHLLTGKDVAIKIIDKSELSSSSRRKLSREVNLMKVLDHPNIIRLLEIIDTEKIMYLVMEYASGGELYEYISKHGRMPENLAREKFRQILSAVEYCHQKHIIHRDLKMENLLLDAQMNIKLADFGFANEFEDGKKLNTFCGSPPYAAPELFKGKEYNGPEVDVWSLGVILFKLVSGTLPFDGHSLSELRDRVLRGRYRIPFYMSTDCEKLLKKMLVLNPSKRHSLQSIMKDPWVNIGYADNPLVPFMETKSESTDPGRIDVLMSMGFTLNAIVSSLKNNNFDEITATYHLLARRRSLEEAKTEQNHEPHSNVDKGSRTPTPSKLQTPDTELVTVVTSNPNQLDPTPVEEEPAKASATSTSCKTPPNNPSPQKEISVPESTPDSSGQISWQNNRKIHIQREYPEKSKPNDNGIGKLNASRPVTTYELPPSGPTSPERPPPSPSKHWYPSLRNGTNPTNATANGSVRNGSIRREIPIERTYAVKSVDENTHSGNTTSFSPSEEKPFERVYKSAIPNTNSKEQPTTKLFPTTTTVQNRLPDLLPNMSSFGRFAPMRQTIHAYRPEIEISPELPGVAESKDSPAVQPRINLSKIDAEESPVIEETHDSPKTKGLLRSLTTRFTRRQSPYRYDGETDEDTELLSKKPIQIQRRSHLASFDEPHSPSSATQRASRVSGLYAESDITYIESPRPNHRESTAESSTSAAFDNATTSRDIRDHPERSPVGFFRSFAQRLSRRNINKWSFLLGYSRLQLHLDGVKYRSLKHNTAGSGGSTNLENSESQPLPRNSSVSLKGKDATSVSVTMPQSILDSVRHSPPKSRINSDATSPRMRRSASSNKFPSKQDADGTISSSQPQPEEPCPKPRTFRFTWSMKAISKQPAEEILKEVKRVLNHFKYSYEEQNRYLLLCEDKTGAHSNRPLCWELEICAVPRLSVNGIRFKKTSGTSVACKSLVTKFFNELNI